MSIHPIFKEIFERHFPAPKDLPSEVIRIGEQLHKFLSTATPKGSDDRRWYESVKLHMHFEVERLIAQAKQEQEKTKAGLQPGSELQETH